MKNHPSHIVRNQVLAILCAQVLASAWGIRGHTLANLAPLDLPKNSDGQYISSPSGERDLQAEKKHGPVHNLLNHLREDVFW